MLGSTLSNDPLPDKRFDFQFDNPPSGYEWSKDFDAVTTREPMQNNPRVRQRLGLHGIEADFGPENADIFRRDLHPDLRADYVLANVNATRHIRACVTRNLKKMRTGALH